jgi:hypothetical protein
VCAYDILTCSCVRVRVRACVRVCVSNTQATCAVAAQPTRLLFSKWPPRIRLQIYLDACTCVAIHVRMCAFVRLACIITHAHALHV